MLFEALRLALAVLLFIVAPGVFLLHALFPRGRGLRGAARIYLVLGGGMMVLMIVGSILGLLPHGERGWFQMIAMGGMPYLEVAMALVCALLFWVARERGAYPRIAPQRAPRPTAPVAAIVTREPKPSEGTDQQP